MELGYSHILSENLLNESKKWYSTENDEKVTYRQHSRKWFFLVLKFCFFQWFLASGSFLCQNAFEKFTTETKVFNGKRYAKKLYAKL